MQKEDGIGWLPLTSSEQHTLNEQWPKLWPSDALSIQAAVKVMKREGFDAVHRAAHNMAMRTQTMPSDYWPIDSGEQDAPAKQRPFVQIT